MNRLTLFIVAVTVVLAGCLGQTDGDTQAPPQVVEVAGPDCTVAGVPCASARVNRYNDDIEIRVRISNNGEEPIVVHTGNEGHEVMVSTCSFVQPRADGFAWEIVGPEGSITPEDGRPYTDTGRRIRDVAGIRTEQGSIQAWPEVWAGETLVMTWQLEVPDETTISRLGYKCPLNFDLSFAQLVRSERQIQLRRDSSVPPVSQVDEFTTSRQPARLVIDSPDSFVTAEDKVLVVNSYLQNAGRGTITDISELTPVDWITALGQTDANTQVCTDDEIRMYERGTRSGESYRRRCVGIPGEPSGTSEIKWIAFESVFNYRMPLDTQTLTIDPVEENQ